MAKYYPLWLGRSCDLVSFHELPKECGILINTAFLSSWMDDQLAWKKAEKADGNFCVAKLFQLPLLNRVEESILAIFEAHQPIAHHYTLTFIWENHHGSLHPKTCFKIALSSDFWDSFPAGLCVMCTDVSINYERLQNCKLCLFLLSTGMPSDPHS